MNVVQKHTRRLRYAPKLAYAQLVAVIDAGAVSAGIGVGAANTDTDANTSDSIVAVHNATDQTLTGGTFYKFDQQSYVASLDVAGMKSGDVKYSNYTSSDGRNTTAATDICYKGTSWNSNAVMTPERSGGTCTSSPTPRPEVCSSLRRARTVTIR